MTQLIDSVGDAPSRGRPKEMAPNTTVRVSFQGVAKEFSNGHRATEPVTLDVSVGEFVAIVGPSGCGKSTLLNMTAGVLKASRGQVVYNGDVVNGPNKKVGYITQEDSLMRWRTVRGNISLPLEFQRVPKAERVERVESALRQVNLTRFADTYPDQLSGGMRKRVAIARTLVYEPETILMDEPFGSLDAQLRVVMHNELLHIFDERRPTILFVTHDLNEAVALADRVVVMSRSPGHIKHIEKIHIPRPRDVLELQSTEEFRAVVARLWRSIDMPSALEES